MQFLGPIPNGKNAFDGRFAASSESGKNRSGLNVYGSGKYSSLWCIPIIFTPTPTPAGIRYGPTYISVRARRRVIAPGGNILNASLKHANVYGIEFSSSSKLPTLPAATAAHSLAARSCISGFKASRCSVNDNELAVVSYPASRNVNAW